MTKVQCMGCQELFEFDDMDEEDPNWCKDCAFEGRDAEQTLRKESFDLSRESRSWR